MGTSVTRRIAATVASVSICFSTACTSLSPVAADATGTRIRAEIKPGDTVRVLTADGTRHTLMVSTVGESSVAGNAVRAWNGGSDAAGTRIELPYRDIQKIEVQHVSALKTTALVSAVALVAAVAIVTQGGTQSPSCCGH
jgi:hypothetical protein